MKKTNGITLIALIITVIVMLILVAVTVSVVINSNLIGVAKNTANATKTAYEEEGNLSTLKVGGKEYLSLADYEAGRYVMPEKAGTRFATTGEYSDGKKTAMIPAGFTVSGIRGEETIDGGLVIYDIPEEDLKDSTKVDWTDPDTVKTNYNQFVWIPVEVNKTEEPVDTEESIASFKRNVWQDNARVENNVQSPTSFPSSNVWSEYTEPYSFDNTNDFDGTSGTGIAAQIAELTESIYNYGGFYIGRYEAGSATERTDSSSQTDPFVVQQDKYPYTYIKWGTDMGNVSSEGAVYLSNNLYSNTNTNYGATSMLCTGACWDAILDFVKDSSHNVTNSSDWGNYRDASFNITRGEYAIYNTTDAKLGSFQEVTGSYKKQSETESSTECRVLLTTGATERNSSKNIYDIAGNSNEWTTEAYYSTRRLLRGR